MVPSLKKSILNIYKGKCTMKKMLKNIETKSKTKERTEKED
jgi:hypothetical protein